MDQSSVTILNWNIDEVFEGIHLKQHPLEQDYLILSDPIIKFRNENQIWLQANSEHIYDGSHKIYSLRMSIDEVDLYL